MKCTVYRFNACLKMSLKGSYTISYITFRPEFSSGFNFTAAYISCVYNCDDQVCFI